MPAQLVTLVFAVFIAGCTASNPPLALAERFELIALTDDAGRPLDGVFKWSWPLHVEYHGPDRFRADVAQHAELLGKLAGLPVRMVAAGGSMVVRIDGRPALREESAKYQPAFTNQYLSRDFTCFAVLGGGRIEWSAMIGISNDLTPRHIRLCIIQEMTQSLGLWGDLNGRTDTNFTSGGGAAELTEHDYQIISILFDDRLRSGMPRSEVLALLPEIIADLEADR